MYKRNPTRLATDFSAESFEGLKGVAGYIQSAERRKKPATTNTLSNKVISQNRKDRVSQTNTSKGVHHH